MSSANTNTAFVYPGGGGLSSIVKTTFAIPTPKAHEVLVRVHAVSLNYRDYLVAAGMYPFGLKKNLVLGTDLAGEIVEVGDEIEDWTVGERVTTNLDPAFLFGPASKKMRNLGGEVDGVLQQYRIFNAEQLVRAPNHLSYEELACWPCAGVSVWNALFNSSVPIGGKNVVFQGTGGVSMLGLILANAVGAKTIITSSSDEKLELAKKLGATHTINYKTHPDWDRVVLELTNGEGAHHVVDNVGINEIEKSLNCVAYGGTVDCIGFLGGQPKTTPNIPVLAMTRSAMIRGIFAGNRQLLEDLLTFVERHGLRPHIDKVFAFEDTVKAIEYVGSGQHFGKVVIRVSN